MFYHRLLTSMIAPTSSSEALDFIRFWEQTGLRPAKPFSRHFKDQSGLPTDVNNLLDIQQMWRNAVDMLHVDGLDDLLTIIYRSQTKVTRETRSKAEKMKGVVNATATTDVEELLPAPTSMSLEVPQQPRSTLNDDDARKSSTESTSSSDSERSPERPATIGTKQFLYDGKRLDDYLSSALEFWYGKRPPQGVDVHLTRRCT
jgi:exonuclease V